MNAKSATDKLIKNILRALPDLPYVHRRRSSLPYVLGAIGVAIAGGIATLWLLSPRTRQGTGDVAKRTEGKSEERAAAMPPPKGEPDIARETPAVPNGTRQNAQRV